MKRKRRDVVNSDELLLAWHLKRQSKVKPKRISKYGKDFISSSFSQLIYYKGIPEDSLHYILSHFLQEGIITELYIEIRKHNEEKDTLDLLETRHFKAKDVLKAIEKDFFFFLVEPLEMKDGTLMFSYEIKIDLKKTQVFIETYLDKWKNDLLFLDGKNFLRAEKQIGKVVAYVYELLKNYPPTNLILNRRYDWDDELDYIANVLFLESINDAEIIGLTITEKKNVAFRLNITDKFYKDFEDTGFLGNCKFNFERLKQVKGKKGANKISLKAPKLLTYKKIEYEIKSNKVPYHLIHLAKERNGIVEEDKLKQITKEKPEAIKKALNNFRTGLRKKFGFPSTEQFFELRGGLIEFKQELFDFL